MARGEARAVRQVRGVARRVVMEQRAAHMGCQPMGMGCHVSAMGMGRMAAAHL